MEDPKMSENAHPPKCDIWPNLAHPWAGKKEDKWPVGGNDCKPKSDPELKGIVVFYINVGTLPPFNAEGLVEKMKEKMDLSRIKKNYEVFFIPVREGTTRIEYIPFGAK